MSLKKMIQIKTNMIIETLAQHEPLDKFDMALLQIQAAMIKQFEKRIQAGEE